MIFLRTLAVKFTSGKISSFWNFKSSSAAFLVILWLLFLTLKTWWNFSWCIKYRLMFNFSLMSAHASSSCWMIQLFPMKSLFSQTLILYIIKSISTLVKPPCWYFNSCTKGQTWTYESVFHIPKSVNFPI